MRHEFSTKHNCVISDRAFWLGLAVYVLSFIAIASVYAGNVSDSITEIVPYPNRTGTLIFGARELPETHRFLSQENYRYGAVTLHTGSANDFSARLNWVTGLTTQLESLVGKVADVPATSLGVSGGNRMISSGTSDAEITPMQIAMGEQSSFISEDVIAAPEPATWFAAVLVAGAVTWSQRRRFARSFSKL